MPSNRAILAAHHTHFNSLGGIMDSTNDTPTYEAPMLTVVGTIAEVTQGSASGAATDASFPAGTPFADLTFS